MELKSVGGCGQHNDIAACMGRRSENAVKELALEVIGYGRYHYADTFHYITFLKDSIPYPAAVVNKNSVLRQYDCAKDY